MAVCPLMVGLKAHQLELIAVPPDGFVCFQQLIIYHTRLIPPITRHELWAMDVWLGCRCKRMAGLFTRSFLLRVTAVDIHLTGRHSSLQNVIPFCVFGNCAQVKKDVSHLSVSNRTAPNSLIVGSFPGPKSVSQLLNDQIPINVQVAFESNLGRVMSSTSNFFSCPGRSLSLSKSPFLKRLTHS